MSDESCNLPNPCDCKQCEWWAENAFDMSRTVDWQVDRWHQLEEDEYVDCGPY